MQMRNRLINRDSSDSSSFVLDIGGDEIDTSSSHKLTTDNLLRQSPLKFGYLLKKNNSILARVFPCLFSRWKSRYFILIGNFLYRFSSDQSNQPKGAPIPLDSVRVNIIDDSCIELTMIRKVYVIRADTAKEATEWVKAIHERKYTAVKETMGHVALDPKIAEINKQAYKIFQKKLRSEAKALGGASSSNGAFSSFYY